MDDEVLEKAVIVVTAKHPTNKSKKITNMSFSHRAMPEEKQRSMLGDEKYSPGVGPAWKSGSACFLSFYKTNVNEPDPGIH